MSKLDEIREIVDNSESGMIYVEEIKQILDGESEDYFDYYEQEED